MLSSLHLTVTTGTWMVPGSILGPIFRGIVGNILSLSTPMQLMSNSHIHTYIHMTPARDPKQLFFMITSRVHSVRRRLCMCKHLGGIWKHMETSRGIWRHLEGSRGIWRHLVASGSIWMHLEASRSIWKHLETSGSHLRGI